MDAKIERNREIYEARLKGASFKELAVKYGITDSCVRTIFVREERKEKLKDTQYYQILTSLTDNEEMITRTIHVLERNELDSNEALLNVTKIELQRCRNCGDVMIDLILKIADVIRSEQKG